MFSTMLNLFTKHPQNVKQTYFEHLIDAEKYGIKLVFAGACECVHGIFPFVDIFNMMGTTSTVFLNNISEEIEAKKVVKKIE
jgi:hypothetical protein